MLSEAYLFFPFSYQFNLSLSYFYFTIFVIVIVIMIYLSSMKLFICLNPLRQTLSTTCNTLFSVDDLNLTLDLTGPKRQVE